MIPEADDRHAPPPRSWEAVAATIAAMPLGDPDARELLASICLAQDTTSPDFSRSSRPGELPDGRPGKVLVRSAAARLLKHLEIVDATRSGPMPPEHADTQAHAQRVLATTKLFQTAQPNVLVDGQEELALARTRCLEAVQLAKEGRDPAVLAFALLRSASAAHSQQDWRAAMQQGRASAELIEDILPTLDSQGTATAFGIYQAAGRRAVWTQSPAVEATVLACLGWARMRGTAAAAGDLQTWQEGFDRALPLARSIRHERPLHLLTVLGGLRGISRRRGDRRGFNVSGDTLRSWLKEENRLEIRLGLELHDAHEARSLGDWERAYPPYCRRIDMLVAGYDGAPQVGSAPQAYFAVLDFLLARGSTSVVNEVGNTAYEIADCLWESLRAVEDHAGHAEATGWLKLAERAWRSYGHNGPLAVKFSRARLINDRGSTAERAQATEDALDVSVRALKAPLRINAGILATRSAVPGDPRIPANLGRLIDEATWLASGRLLTVRALWWRRCALESDQLVDSTRAELWQRAESDALEGLRRLNVERLVADPEWAAEAWWTAALAAPWTNGDDQHLNCGIRLERLLSAVNCIGQLLVTVTDLGHRERLARRFGPVMRAALEAAVDLDDPDATDAVLEVLCRDRVAMLINALRRDPDVSGRLRDILDRLIAAQAATPEGDGEATGGDGDSLNGDRGAVGRKAEERGVRRTAGVIRVNRAAARKDADEALGVLGALADASTVTRSHARDVLDARPTGQRVALLQLMPSTASMLAQQGASASEAWLVRRLTLADDSGQRSEWTDRVMLSPELVHAAASFDGSVNQWNWHYQSETFLPKPLLEALASAGRDDPLRLLIVPSGLYRLPLDALAMPGRGSNLIDHAAVSLHPSLSVAQHLMRVSAGQSAFAGNAASYDTELLNSSADELLALRRFFSPLKDIKRREDFFEVLARSGLSMLALAVHGSDDPGGGWGQAKQFPDGKTVTAAETLALSFPPLCVLASCHSSVEARDGIELAGFPLAMFARGADTVIGSLYAIEDESTSQIMQSFWERLATRGDPVRALRDARLTWLDEQPRRRRSLRRWAGLVAYGGAHH